MRSARILRQDQNYSSMYLIAHFHEPENKASLHAFMIGRGLHNREVAIIILHEYVFTAGGQQHDK